MRSQITAGAAFAPGIAPIGGSAIVPRMPAIAGGPTLRSHLDAFLATIGCILSPHARAPTAYRAVDITNWLPSGSLKVANVPHGSFFGGPVNSTPRADSSS
jgi:hypothetical protein